MRSFTDISFLICYCSGSHQLLLNRYITSEEISINFPVKIYKIFILLLCCSICSRNQRDLLEHSTNYKCERFSSEFYVESSVDKSFHLRNIHYQIVLNQVKSRCKSFDSSSRLIKARISFFYFSLSLSYSSFVNIASINNLEQKHKEKEK